MLWRPRFNTFSGFRATLEICYESWGLNTTPTTKSPRNEGVAAPAHQIQLPILLNESRRACKTKGLRVANNSAARSMGRRRLRPARSPPISGSKSRSKLRNGFAVETLEKVCEFGARKILAQASQFRFEQPRCCGGHD
jgi:hypothetical protein